MHTIYIPADIKYRQTDTDRKRQIHTQRQYRSGIQFAIHAKNDYYNYHFQLKVITFFSVKQN